MKSKGTSYVRIISRIRKPPFTLNCTATTLTRDYQYSLFSTPKEGNLVLASEIPVSGELITSGLKTSNDFSAFISFLDKTPSAFGFDSVFGECISQEYFYEREVRMLIQKMIKGHSSTIFMYGPNG